MKIKRPLESTLSPEKTTLLFLALLFSIISFAQTTYYVDVNRPDNSGDGLSFVSAYKDLQVAIDIAIAGDEIRVAKGTYFSTPSTNSSAPFTTFYLDKDLIIRGGYDPVSGVQDLNNPSTLSGDVANNDVVTGVGASLDISNTGDNRPSVIYTERLTNSCIMDGFIITGGRGFSDNGGGMTNMGSSPTLTNLTFFGNSSSSGGAGMRNDRLSSLVIGSSPNLINVTFSKNHTTSSGGAVIIRNSFSSNTIPTFTDVTFFGNYAESQGGGLRAFNSGVNVTFTNVVFTENFANEGGGGISISSNSIATLNNAIFADNGAGTFFGGGGMFLRETGAITMTNVVFARNSAAGKGGGLYSLQTDNVTINNGTFVRNSSSTNGGGMFNELTAPAPILNNSVFYLNVNTTSINDISGNNITPSSRNNASDATGGFINLGQNFVALTADPFFNSFDFDGVDDVFGTADDGLVPDETNDQLINAGENSLNNQVTDAAGQARIIDTNIDIGAYEKASTLGINENDLINNIIVYPNPVKNLLNFNTEKLLNSVEIYNLLGKSVIKYNSRNIIDNSVNISKLPAGLYLVKVSSRGKFKLFKIVKE